jgi:anti-sigma B factor antagonist
MLLAGRKKMELENVGKIKVIRLGGRLDATSGSSLHEAIEEFIKDGSTDILIDMGNLRFISSYGLGVLASSAKRLKEQGGKLKISRMTQEVKVPFEITGTLPHFEIFEDYETAIASFNG